MKKRTETIKFGEFMSGEYKRSQKAAEAKIEPMEVAKGIAKATLLATAIKTIAPAAIVSIPIMLVASHAVKAATAPVVVSPQAIEVAGTISDAAKSKIIHAFDPLVNLMVSLSLPIAGVMITGGCLMVLIGMKEKGYGLITNSSLGYVLVQMSPLLIDLLAGVGNAI